MTTAYIAEGMHPAGIEFLKESHIRTVCPGEDFDPKDVNIIIVRSVFQINASTLETFPALRVAAKLGTGLDNIDQTFCRSNGIAVLNAPGMNSVSTAEFTVTQILACYKNVFEINRRVEARDLRRVRYFGHELADLTAGIIGYGTVGKNVVKRLAPFVERFYVHDVLIKEKREEGNLCFCGEAESFLTECDVLIVCLPLKDNQKYVNKEFLARLKKNIFLVNAARGGLVDEAALIAFLKNNPSAFYYCDVVEQEPDYSLEPEQQRYINPLLELPNVLFTPHIAGMTHECQEKIAIEIAGKISEVLKNEREK